MKYREWTRELISFRTLFLIGLNLLLMFIIGYLTLDSAANTNSRLGGILVSLLLPLFIVLRTRSMGRVERLVRYGSGFVVYSILAFALLGIEIPFATALVPCLLLALIVLYFGEELLAKMLKPSSI